jgi:hypothetical protein
VSLRFWNHAGNKGGQYAAILQTPEFLIGDCGRQRGIWCFRTKVKNEYQITQSYQLILFYGGNISLSTSHKE